MGWLYIVRSIAAIQLVSHITVNVISHNALYIYSQIAPCYDKLIFYVRI